MGALLWPRLRSKHRPAGFICAPRGANAGRERVPIFDVEGSADPWPTWSDTVVVRSRGAWVRPSGIGPFTCCVRRGKPLEGARVPYRTIARGLPRWSLIRHGPVRRVFLVFRPPASQSFIRGSPRSVSTSTTAARVLLNTRLPRSLTRGDWIAPQPLLTATPRIEPRSFTTTGESPGCPNQHTEGH